MTDPEYVARLVTATQIANPKRVEIHLKAELSIIVETRDQPFQTEPALKTGHEKIAPAEKPQTKNLINWLRQYRIEKGISIQALADQVRISKGSLMAYFDEKRAPSETILGRIQKFKETI